VDSRISMAQQSTVCHVSTNDDELSLSLNNSHVCYYRSRRWLRPTEAVCYYRGRRWPRPTESVCYYRGRRWLETNRVRLLLQRSSVTETDRGRLLLQRSSVTETDRVRLLLQRSSVTETDRVRLLLQRSSVTETNRGRLLLQRSSVTGDRPRPSVTTEVVGDWRPTEAVCYYRGHQWLRPTEAVVLGTFWQELRVMYSLCTWQDLLSSHEHVVRVGIFLQHTTLHSFTPAKLLGISVISVSMLFKPTLVVTQMSFSASTQLFEYQ